MSRARLRLILPFAGLLFLTFVHSMQTRRHSQLSEDHALPPPLTDPGPDAATLQLRIVDGRTGRPVSATVSVNGGTREPQEDPYLPYSLRRTNAERQGPMRFRKLDDYFFTDGSVSVRVPPGHCVVEVGKGYEYRRTRRIFELAKREVRQATIAISPWIDMAELGWYSGDTHIHFERDGSNDDQLLVLTSAKGIRYAFSLSMNTGGYALGREFESWGQAHGLGPASDVRRGGYFLSSGQEYRNSSMGHVTVVLADGYVPAAGWTANANLGPSLAVIGDQARELGGYMGLNHGGYYRLEADYVGLTGKADFLELLQLGGYRGLGLDGWYDFLNLGFRWPIVGASDFPYSRELGDSITYVFSETEPTPRSFMEGVVQGRSFVTSGPMLMVSVNGKGPGDSLQFPADQPAGLERGDPGPEPTLSGPVPGDRVERAGRLPVLRRERTKRLGSFGKASGVRKRLGRRQGIRRPGHRGSLQSGLHRRGRPNSLRRRRLRADSGAPGRLHPLGHDSGDPGPAPGHPCPFDALSRNSRRSWTGPSSALKRPPIRSVGR